MTALLDVPAPAKLNLFLHITGRRSDGYHLLQSVFMLIDWCDSLDFELRPTSAISREDLTTALPDDDLIVRAARLLQTHTGCTHGAHIRVRKSIPAQAGMGGGSSDAASTLLALNRLWKLELDRTSLARLGLQLGADVPFFVHGDNAWVEGVGERITPISLPPARFVVVKPPSGLETARIFSDPLLKRDTEPATIYGFAANTFGFGRNDLQAVAQRLSPDVNQALAWLSDKGLQPRMTGSGSAVFAHLPHEVDFSDAPAAFEVRVCSNVGVHPLQGWASGNGLSVGSANCQPV
ncbi:4-(cytidine 5'-diphospho)-2-C-methyl-D-erythritol kinase [Curvibacter sp. APW13]|uniref:4-(cytidine 5'-diphospho)-2-C-methyl-D-erythritol kinase n=1 Tax=Curvibacter sp. APW13 TaxID=3077236 RepID=UPI0028DFF0C5|nr:4-(cytidine 5'-diphospho)-2-C-methyl-D-erythritol kinase [Curvibacter sp. APW13]MDT8992464.1 4-(cytidine 5'-diphospho)-2-C-methyl-D-erythritol kinase [Curvibacter sp. APW13]